ncbi:hypothetical protein [Clostridium pasteurianum]|uniref:Uncharacterized protein n=1 Tax=Clostridium pasteurianum BC1 TaxID=86416 RepID=R4JWH7_CLOPA|nr:hypothetical protein [Clostridium pasteurianum]AGK95182.1 hypothetical protein Clopa_0082 [Clostridium pasteurianum BC1]
MRKNINEVENSDSIAELLNQKFKDIPLSMNDIIEIKKIIKEVLKS